MAEVLGCRLAGAISGCVMVDVLHFYMDDSGTRRPNHKVGKKAAHGYDWFALGGVLVKEEDEPEVRRQHQAFIERFNISSPLHSVEIRGRNEGFLWLNDLGAADQAEFYEALYLFMRDCPVTGIACVIDRPGYNRKYSEKYGRNPWSLCKTSFTVSVERAAKCARRMNRKLRVFPERCNKADDETLKGYYGDMRTVGMPFAADTSTKYGPLTQQELKDTLYDFKPKQKTSPMIQLADLYLWPICMGGYHQSNRPYQRLKADGKLIECVIEAEAVPTEGTKYSCFEEVVVKP